MCVDCGCGNCFDPTTIVLNEGQDGSDGLFGGYSAYWYFDTNTAVSPASTRIRLNNSTYSLVNEIFVADNNADAIDHSTFVNSLNPYGNYGFIKLFDANDSTRFWLGRLTSITDNGTYFTLGVTYIFSNSSFSNNSSVVMSFTPATSTQMVLSNTFAVGNTNALIWTTIGTYTLPANTVTANGKKIKLKAVLRFVNISTASCQYRLRIDGANVHATLTEFQLNGPDTMNAIVELDFDRVSNTSAYVHLRNTTFDVYYMQHLDQAVYTNKAAINFTTTPIVFTVDGIVGASTEYIYLDQLEVIVL